MSVSSDTAIELAPLRYKYLEIVQNRELPNHHGNYNLLVPLDCHAQELVSWWVKNRSSIQVTTILPLPTRSFCDASLIGWGAVTGNTKTKGHWAHV